MFSPRAQKNKFLRTGLTVDANRSCDRLSKEILRQATTVTAQTLQAATTAAAARTTTIMASTVWVLLYYEGEEYPSGQAAAILSIPKDIHGLRK